MTKKTLPKDFKLSSEDLETLKKLREEKEKKTKTIDPYSQSWNWLCKNTDAFNSTWYPITVIVGYNSNDWYVAMTDSSYAHIEMMDHLHIHHEHEDPLGYIKARISWNLKKIDVCSLYRDKRGELLDTPKETFEEIIRTEIIPQIEKHVNVSHNYIDNYLLIQPHDSVEEIPHSLNAYSPYAETFETGLRRKFNVEFKGDCGLFD